MSLTRLQQLFIAQERIEGTASTSNFTAAAGKYLAIDPTMTFEVETYQRDVARESFTPLSPLAGAVLGTCSFSLEAAAKTGTAATSTRPAFDLPLIACGFRRELCYRITLSPATITGGPLRHGTIINQTLSGATLYVVGDYYTGAPYIWATKGEIGGTAYLANSTAVTSGSAWTFTGGSFSSTGTPAVDAVGWFPSSVQLYAMTFATGSPQTFAKGVTIVGQGSGNGVAVAYYNTGGTTPPTSSQSVIVRRLQGSFAINESVNLYDADTGVLLGSVSLSSSVSTAFVQVGQVGAAVTIGLSKDGIRESIVGARGNVTISGNIGEPMLMNFTFQGIKDAVVDSGAVSGIAYDDATPPVLLGSTVSIGDDAISSFGGQKTLCTSTFTADMGNDIQYRRCMTASTGIDGIYFNGRTPTLAMDPELTQEVNFDLMANYFAANRVRMDVVAGVTAPSKFRLNFPSMAVQSIGQGDRNGLIVRDTSFALHSGSSSSVSGDNEFAIIWDTGV